MLSAAFIRVQATGALTVSGVLTTSADLLCEGTVHAGRIITAALPTDLRCSGAISANVIILMNDSTYNYGEITATDTMALGPSNGVVNYGGLSAIYCFSDGQLYNHGTSDFHHGSRISGIVNSGTLMGDGMHRVGLFFNEESGIVRVDSLVLLGGPENRGRIITDSLFQCGNELNTPHLTVYGGASIVSYGDLGNYGTINGTGSICVARHTVNHGTLDGVIDFCDATPTVSEPPFIDVNDGTVWGGVHFCSTNFCATIMSVDEQQALQAVQVAPNPANGRCVVHWSSGLFIASYDLIDPHGRTVQHKGVPSSGELVIDAPGMAGVFYLVLHGRGGARAIKPLVFLP